MRKLPYDTVKDFAPIALLTTSATMLTAHTTLPVNSIPQLVATAKTNPGTITIGVLPGGGFNTLCAVLFEAMAGIQLSHVSYRGAPAAITDLLAGQISLTFTSIPTVLSFIKSGRLKGLAVSTTKRSSILPDIPTLHESGVSGYEATLWYGIIAPAGIPDPIVNKLYAGIASAMSAPEVQTALQRQGLEPSLSGSAEFGKRITAEIGKWGKVIRTAR